MKRKVLYVGWVGFGNHGDDICLDIFTNRFRSAGQKAGLELEVVSLFPSRFDEFTLARISPHLVVLGAGSLFEMVYLKPLALAQQAGIPTAIWGSGYDSAGQDMAIPHDLAYALRQVVAGARAVGIRGPYTLEALKSIGVEHDSLTVTGDPGLLWPPEGPQEPHGEERLPQIAVNWGTANNNVLGRNEKHTGAQLARVLQELADEHRLLIYPMWPKDVDPCLTLAHAVNRPDRVQVLSEVPSPSELKAIYLESMFSINMKLHANVFSAAQGCPFIALAYRWKCMDFAESVGCAHLAIPFSEPNLQDRLGAAVAYVIGQYERHKAHVEKEVAEARLRLRKLEDQMLALLKM